MTNYRQYLFELKNGIPHSKANEPEQKPKPQPKQKPIPKRSKKMVAEIKLLKPLVKKYLARPENQRCKIKSPVCTKIATCVNHKKRRGKNLLNEKYFEPACPPCNLYVEENPTWAYEHGHLISIHKKD